MKYLDLNDYRIDTRNDGTNLYRLDVINKNNQKITFHDSFKIITFSLEESCEIFNLKDEDKKKKIDYSKFI
jgi:hypothetical protein